jgi:hypothetical protein
MKKTIILVLVLISLFTVAKASYAVTTIFMGETVEGRGENYDAGSVTGDMDTTVIHFTDITDIKKVKIDIDYEFGNYKYLVPQSMGSWDIQIGFPVKVNEKGLVYFTVGAINYAEYSNPASEHEANGALLGLNVICTPTEKFQFELNLQHSVGGSSKLNSVDSSLDMILLRTNIQYVFTDTLGLAIHYTYMDYNANNPSTDAVDLSSTSIGLIYKF